MKTPPKHLILSIALTGLLLLTSCVTNKKTTYLQAPKKAISQMPVTPETYRVQVSDNLFIKVVTPDPKWASMFNTLPVATGTMSTTEQTTDLISYTVQTNGSIDIPFVGEVPVAGKTLKEIKHSIKASLVDYITDFDVTIKLVNNSISLIGDVANPGRYPIYKGQLTIFEALAMAGDLNEYSNRRFVQVIRSTPSGTEVNDIDLTGRDILSSEFYYVMPNDIIYAEPMKGKFFQMNQFPFTLLLSTISTTILILKYVE